MGREARLKKQTGIQLDERDARRLLTAQKNYLQAQVSARAAIDKANADLKAATKAQSEAFDALAAKYQLDPTARYALDDETLMLTPQ